MFLLLDYCNLAKGQLKLESLRRHIREQRLDPKSEQHEPTFFILMSRSLEEVWKQSLLELRLLVCFPLCYDSLQL